MFWLFSYEGEEGTPAPTPTVKVFTQEEVNSINKKANEAAKQAAEEAKQAKELLSQLQNQHKMTEEEKAELANKLSEYEKAKLTEEEKKQLELDKIKQAHENEKNELASKLNETTSKLNNLLITRTITEAALEGKIVAIDGTGQQALLVLKHQAEVNEEGEVIIKNFTWTDSGKSFTEDLPAKEAVAKMKAMAEWSNFWKDPANPGWKNHIHGTSEKGDQDYKGLSQSEYEEARAKRKLAVQKRT